MSWLILKTEKDGPPSVMGNLQNKDAAIAMVNILNYFSFFEKQGYLYYCLYCMDVSQKDGVDILKNFFYGESKYIEILKRNKDLCRNKLIKSFLETL